MTPSGHLVPQQLEFYTPRMQWSYAYNSMAPLTPLTPATPGNSSKMSDVESLDSNDTTSVTPDFSRLKLGRSRGRPRKELIQPTMDDFPKDGTDAEKENIYVKRPPNCGSTKNWQVILQPNIEPRKTQGLRSTRDLKKGKLQVNQQPKILQQVMMMIQNGRKNLDGQGRYT